MYIDVEYLDDFQDIYDDTSVKIEADITESDVVQIVSIDKICKAGKRKVETCKEIKTKRNKDRVDAELESVADNVSENDFEKVTTDDTSTKAEKRNVNTSKVKKQRKSMNRAEDKEIRGVRRGKMVYRSAENDYLPTVNFEELKKTCNVDVEILTHEEQMAEIAARRDSEDYRQSQHKCAPCGKIFRCEETYRRHRVKHDREGEFECPACKFRFKLKSKLWNHLDDTHRIKYVCRECGFVSRTRTQAGLHHAFHAGKIYQCKYCDKQFSKCTSYLSHVRIIHKTMHVTCDMCGEPFIGEMGLKMHKAREHGVTPKKYRECKTCSVTFMSNDALKRHQETGAQKNHARLSPCVQCGENFESADALKQHADSEHPTCTECYSTFLNAESYNVHVKRKHLGEGNSQQGKRRTRNHAVGGRPQIKNKCCEICGKMYNSFHMRIHMRQHTGELPFACDHCPKRFGSKSSIMFHMRAHTGYKPYKCEHCGLAFSIKSNHQRHVNVVHQGIRKTATCHVCGHVSATPSTLKIHVRAVHYGEPWPKRAPRKKRTQK
ncbi:zinc finger protein 878-like [Leguminivora glycinivorella]|uniref:zinc finger protein 878-like n=1 Tax=Leguminivora glycinivorella TaxID=1035111 RepID=UPI002010443E|nr:zinc finger protein 878-like [Leguminivora glycinivorella]